MAGATLGFVNPDSGDLPYPATEDAEKLQSILTHLADAKEPKGSQPAVPEHGLKGHKAILFLDSTKGALGVGVEVGYGFLIKVLDDGGADGGKPKLSPPLPVSTSKIGFSLLDITFKIIYTAILIDNEDDIPKFYKGKLTFGKDITLERLKDFKNDSVVSHSTDTAGAKVVSVANNHVLLDIFLSGGLIEVDYDKARQIFGEGKTPEQILSGAVRTPSEFAPVYEYLTKRFL